MRIGYDAKRAYFNRAGLGNYARNLLRALYRYFPEHAYHLFSPAPSDLFQPAEAGFHFKEHFPEGLLKGSIWRSFGIPPAARKADIQLFHGLSHELPLTSFGKGIPTVLGFHDLIYERYPEHFPAFDRRMYQFKYRRSARKADRIIAISPQTSEDLQEFYGIPEERIRIVVPSIDPAYTAQFNPANDRRVMDKYRLSEGYLLNVGTFNYRKNQDFLLKAASAYLKDVQVVFVGDRASHFDAFMEQMPAAGDDVRVLTDVPSGDLPAIYRAAGLYVHTAYFEGFGLPIIEALHSNTPVLVPDTSCYRYFKPFGVHFYEEGEPDALRERIHSILDNDSRIPVESLNEFSPQQQAQRTIEVYKELL